jgi:hypothetical protein
MAADISGYMTYIMPSYEANEKLHLTNPGGPYRKMSQFMK